jgi:hypothetical protein
LERGGFMDLLEREELIRETKKAVSDSIDLRADITDEQIRDAITAFVFEKSKKILSYYP